MTCHKINILGLLVLMSLVLNGCRQAEVKNVDADEEKEKSVPVMIYKTKPETISRYLKLTGGLEAQNETMVYSQTTEKLASIKVKTGDKVKKGQVLAIQYNQILKQSIAQYEAAVQTALAEDELAQQDHQRTQELYNKQILSKQELDQAESEIKSKSARVNQARAQLSRAKEEYANSFIKAPFAGKVAMVFYEEGDMVNSGEAVVKIVNASTVKAKLEVPENYISYISLGQRVFATFPAIPDKQFVGVITQIDEAIDPDTRSLEIEVNLENAPYTKEKQEVAQGADESKNAENTEKASAEKSASPETPSKPLLKSGLFGEFKIEIERHEHVVVISDNAVISQTEVELNEFGEQKTVKTSHVYLIEQGRAKLQDVETGIYSSGRVELTSGITIGDEVIVVGQNIVKDGDSVTITNSQPEE